MLHCYSEAIRGKLSKILRLKIVALVTVEVHARDVIDKLAKAGCNDVNAFDWLCQLRLYWDKVCKEGGKEETAKTDRMNEGREEEEERETGKWYGEWEKNNRGVLQSGPAVKEKIFSRQVSALN